jgi:phosphonate transport system substrate-binding protein
MQRRFSRTLDYLEADAGVRIDLQIYRGYSNATKALASDKVHLTRPGPAAYVIARKADPAIKVLVKQLHDGKPAIRGLIFTSNPAIGDLSKLAGHTFVFGDPESTFGNYMPKLKLMEVGTYAKDLAACCTHTNAHDAVVEAVKTGAFEAGSANANYVEKAIEEGAELTVLKEMQSISFPWVASSRLDPVLRARIVNSLLKLKDGTILHEIDRDLDGFVKADAMDYDEFEREMEKEKLFGK